MDFWTFAILIVIIIVAGDVVKKTLHSSQVNASKKSAEKEIEKIKVQMDELDNYTKYRIEKRLQAIETIVVSNEYNLEMKFKRLVDD
ncbi:MAG: hypothetical protein GX654_01215 [Desulfatiglans sp.]|nr:hypothetical protein [Desulfatiglans sp.]